uniref:Arginine/serine-rich splicing factor RS28 transcript II n=1 Tax=Sorghum bicolor TaxID=4558 RepID=M1H986_SORBI|nr:arginine/serine-rich splicing factor RS28 transcript II [Sorghum bicolor]
MRPVFVGNLDYDTRHSELDQLFYRYGRVERIDMKSGTTRAKHQLLKFLPFTDLAIISFT